MRDGPENPSPNADEPCDFLPSRPGIDDRKPHVHVGRTGDPTRAAFAEQFGGQPTVMGCAPGRVELLGNHTDYNGGLVMAAAIDRFTVAAGRPVPGKSCRVHAVNYRRHRLRSRLDKIERSEDGDWANYVKGVVWAIQDAAGPQLSSAFELAIAGNVPLGAGLSSSASLEAAIAFFLLQAGWSRAGRARSPGPS